MQPNDKRTLVMITTVLLLVVAERGRFAGAGENIVVAHEGVTARILVAPFSGKTASLGESAAETLSLDQLPKTATGYPVLETNGAIVSWASDHSGLVFWTRHDDRLTRHAEIALCQVAAPARCRLMADARHRLSVEVDFPGDRMRHVVTLTRDGILEIKQPPGRTVTVSSPMRYVLVPSLIGTDLLFDPEILPGGVSTYLPSLNMVVGLAAAR